MGINREEVGLGPGGAHICGSEVPFASGGKCCQSLLFIAVICGTSETDRASLTACRT